MLDRSKDQLRNKLYEEYENSLFKLIMFEAAEKEGRVFLEKNEQLKKDPAYLPSVDEENWFQKQLNRNIRNKTHLSGAKMLRSFANKVAVAMLVVAFAFTGAVFTVQAFRTDVLNFLIRIEPKYTSIQLDESEKNKKEQSLTVNWKNAYVPAYIPDGFEADSLYYSDPLKTITYHKKGNDQEFIVYSEYDASNDVELDTENASLIKIILVHGHKGTLVIKNSIVSVTWEMDGHIFTVKAKQNEDEVIKIAQNVNFVK
ncbi:MAG: DUF4367 domain-containing protein [Eubacteriales bacterium]|jgi:hypothetical protein